jgi:hypothetical protein
MDFTPRAVALLTVLTLAVLPAFAEDLYALRYEVRREERRCALDVLLHM